MYIFAEQGSLRVLMVRWSAFLAIIGLSVFVGARGLAPDLSYLFEYAASSLLRAYDGFVHEYQFSSAYFWGPLMAVILVERLRPANQSQEVFSVGLICDLIWFVSGPLFVVFFVSRFREHLGAVYVNHFDFLTIQSLRNLPLWGQIVIVLLASDFLSWFSHWLRHKVKLFWHFHSIHHSQRQLNMMTDHRVHPVEKLVSAGIRFLPMTLLELRHGVNLGIAWWLFTNWHTMIYHGNIKSNYGWLRFILVTPQSHRIHHSVMPEHQDKNFGTIFSFWDFLFGTQYRGYEEYPEVGVSDQDSPVERSKNPLSAILVFGKQLIYPFKLILRKGV